MLNLDDPRLRLNDLLTKYEGSTVAQESASQPAQAEQELSLIHI